jgi:cytochrome c peroxidase
MNALKMMFSRILPVRWHPSTNRIAVLLVILTVTGSAVAVGLAIYRPFRDDSGKVQSAPSDVTISTATGSVIPVTAPLDPTNRFFDANFGTNGQACVTCHLPSDGITVHVATIQNAFQASGGTDPLFRPNDTANNPNIPLSSHTADDYSLILNLGVIRVGKTFTALAPLAVPNFTAVAADQATIDKFGGPFPLGSGTNPIDPQQGAGHATLSLFRRPLVNTNVHLDSSVLWDGRASIGNMRAQVIGAAKALLLASNPTNDDADQVAAFMLGVYTDQVFDTAAGTDAAGNCTLTAPGQQCGAGLVSARGAGAGVQNLLTLALSANVPCTNFLETNPLAGGVGCVSNTPSYDLFDSWATLPDAGTNAGRLAVARGQNIFNTAMLQVPPDLAGQFGQGVTQINCTTCHATRNIGNNPDATFFRRVGTDSLDIIDGLISSSTGPTHDDLVALRARVSQLPLYQLTATGSNSCGITSEATTDPGRAMVSGDICDVGKFKPPILRGLAARSPYFHAGAAENIQMLIHFYNARFQIGLNEDQVNDLGAFVEAQ